MVETISKTDKKGIESATYIKYIFFFPFYTKHLKIDCWSCYYYYYAPFLLWFIIHRYHTDKTDFNGLFRWQFENRLFAIMVTNFQGAHDKTAIKSKLHDAYNINCDTHSVSHTQRIAMQRYSANKMKIFTDISHNYRMHGMEISFNKIKNHQHTSEAMLQPIKSFILMFLS